MPLILTRGVLPRPQVFLRAGPLVRRPRVAEDLQVLRKVRHLGAFGEAADPAVQERAARAVQGVLPVERVVPGHVADDRHEARDQQQPHALPVHPAQQQGHHHDGQQRLPHGPDDRGVADHQPRDHGHGDRRLVEPAERGHRHGDEEDEQHIRHHHVLNLQFEHVEQDRQRRQGRPPPRQPAAAQHRVAGHAQQDAHEGLQGGDQGQVVQRQQREQEQRVPAGPHHVRDVIDRIRNVVVGVAVPEDRAVAEHDHAAQRDRDREHDAELPVRGEPAPRPGQHPPGQSRRARRAGRSPRASGRPPPGARSAVWLTLATGPLGIFLCRVLLCRVLLGRALPGGVLLGGALLGGVLLGGVLLGRALPGPGRVYRPLVRGILRSRARRHAARAFPSSGCIRQQVSQIPRRRARNVDVTYAFSSGPQAPHGRPITRSCPRHDCCGTDVTRCPAVQSQTGSILSYCSAALKGL